jgi:death-on-curing protein
MSKYSWIDPKTLKMLHEESLSTHGGSRGVRDIGLFESAMSRSENLAYYNEEADIADLAASYAYGLAKNHPFVDGNKRAAFLSIGLFLGINGYRLTATPVDAIKTILAMASSNISEEELGSWSRDNMKPQ